MKVKKFKAVSMPEAMKTIRAELGEKAVILQSKTIYTGGFLGFFKKKNIEVVAAVDPQLPAQPERKIKAAAEMKPSPLVIPSSTISKANQADSGRLIAEMEELKNMVALLSKQQVNLAESCPDELQQPIIRLQEQEVENELVSDLSAHLIKKWKHEKGNISLEQVRDWSKEWLIAKLAPIQDGKGIFQKKYINIVGPTGVGKTTTLAKMAASLVLEDKKKIAFITADTYRIAAIEQLKVYADLLKVPVEVVYKAEDFQQAVEKYKDYDFVFIDTAGRNFRDKKYVDELEKIIPFDKEVESYLVMSLTSKQKDMEDIVGNFSNIPINYFIFTKLDETKTWGSLVNLMYNNRKSTAFVTNGQNVPDDLMKITPEKLAHLLFEDTLW